MLVDCRRNRFLLCLVGGVVVVRDRRTKQQKRTIAMLCDMAARSIRHGLDDWRFTNEDPDATPEQLELWRKFPSPFGEIYAVARNASWPLSNVKIYWMLRLR